MPGGGQTEKIQSDDYDDVLIFFFSTPRLDVRHVASSPEASSDFEVSNRETLFCGLLRPSLGPIFYLGELGAQPTKSFELGWRF